MNFPPWVERASPGDLGGLLRKAASPRKSGLFVRHLCRSNPGPFADPRSLAALDAADRYEAGEIDESTLRAAVRAADEAAEQAEGRYRAASAAGHPPASCAAAF